MSSSPASTTSVAYVVAPAGTKLPEDAMAIAEAQAAPGELPAGGVGAKIIVTGLVVGVNPVAHTISLVNPPPAGGEIRTLTVKNPAVPADAATDQGGRYHHRGDFRGTGCRRRTGEVTPARDPRAVGAIARPPRQDESVPEQVVAGYGNGTSSDARKRWRRCAAWPARLPDWPDRPGPAACSSTRWRRRTWAPPRPAGRRRPTTRRRRSAIPPA